MTDYEKLFNGLECCSTNRLRRPDCEEMTCSYLDLYDHGCVHQLIRDAFAWIKAHEPRVMTLEEVQTAENCMEPVFLEIRDYRSTPDVFSWRTVKHINPINDKPIYVLDCVGFSSALYSETYGYLWRCWTSRPTDAQREATPWN